MGQDFVNDPEEMERSWYGMKFLHGHYELITAFMVQNRAILVELDGAGYFSDLTLGWLLESHFVGVLEEIETYLYEDV